MPSSGTVLTRPFDLLVGSREDPYGLTHLLFYVTDFGRSPTAHVGRPHDAILADVEALVIRYLDQGDYDLVGELLMAWPQLREEWSPVAAFALRVLAHVEDEVGILPCGNVDPERLATLVGAERTRYARAASYHTALVMGFLCAVGLRGHPAPPKALTGPEYPDDAWQTFRAMIDDHPGDWLPVFDRCGEAEKRTLAPMLCGLVITQAMRQQDFAAMHEAVDAARRFALPPHPLQAAATDLLRTLGAAMEVGARAPTSDEHLRVGDDVEQHTEYADHERDPRESPGLSRVDSGPPEQRSPGRKRWRKTGPEARRQQRPRDRECQGHATRAFTVERPRSTSPKTTPTETRAIPAKTRSRPRPMSEGDEAPTKSLAR